jgi:urease accessory protein UreE
MIKSELVFEQVRNIIRKVKQQNQQMGELLEESIVITEEGVIFIGDDATIMQILSSIDVIED